MVKHYEYLDALRGLAILGVIMVHTHNHGVINVLWLRAIIEHGNRGVQLFFVVSAIALMSSWNGRKESDQHLVRNFFVRRFFRIAPMFYIGIISFLFLYGFAPRYWAPEGISWSHVIATAAFVHGWHPVSINSVVPGGWSIAVEVTFYLLFPAIAVYVRTMSAAVLLLLVSLTVNYLQDGVMHRMLLNDFVLEQHYLIDNFLSLWFPSQLPVFVLGVLSYHVISHIANGELHLQSDMRFRYVFRSYSIVAILLLAVLLPLLRLANSHIVYGALFATLAVLLHFAPNKFAVNPITCFIGKVSFSAYFWHWAILEYIDPEISVIWGPPEAGGRTVAFFACFYFVVVILTVLFATITYLLVEKPSLKLANEIIARGDKGSHGRQGDNMVGGNRLAPS